MHVVSCRGRRRRRVQHGSILTGQPVCLSEAVTLHALISAGIINTTSLLNSHPVLPAARWPTCDSEMHMFHSVYFWVLYSPLTRSRPPRWQSGQYIAANLYSLPTSPNNQWTVTICDPLPHKPLWFFPARFPCYTLRSAWCTELVWFRITRIGSRT